MAQETNVRLKLLIDSETQNVLYGEANKDFIDFLFNLLSLPLGGVIRLLKKEQMVGCLGNLYESVETLSETCFQEGQSKDKLLKPKVSFNCSTKLLPCIIETSSTTSSSSATTSSGPRNFGCSSSNSFPLFGSTGFGSTVFGSSYVRKQPPPFGSYVSTQPGLSNASSGRSNFSPVRNEASSGLFNVGPFPRESAGATMSTSQASTGGEKVGFVKDLATYIVMDDLTVQHISDFSVTTLFKKFNIKDVGSLEEKVITLNVDEGVEILKASLQSKMVLTNVFLRRD